MDSIVVKASDLIALASDLKAHKIEYVHLSIEDPDLADPDVPLPACIFVSGIASKDQHSVVDFDVIESADIDSSTFIPVIHTNIVD